MPYPVILEHAASDSSSSSASPADCEFGIRLRMELSSYTFPTDPVRERPIRPQAWRMRVTVTEVNNIDPEIFVYNRGTVDEETGDKRNMFQAVASPTDLIEYPVGNPDGLTDHPFFRLAAIDMVHRSQDVLDATWDGIKSDVDDLIDTSVRLCELEFAETHSAGTLPSDEVEAPEEEAASSSESGEGSLSVECPVDLVASLIVVDSTDPSIPAGSLLMPVGGVSQDCERTWQHVSDKEFEIVTSLVTHFAVLTVRDGLTVVAGPADAGLSHTYGAMFSYAYSPTQEHTLYVQAS